MKLGQFILNLFLSVLFIMTPVLGLSFELNHEKVAKATCCSTEMENNEMNCHENEISDNHSQEHKSCSDKCKDNCNDHACHVLILTIQAPKLQTSNYSDLNIIKNNQNSFYQEFTLQNFIDQFWNPPKLG